MAGLLDFNDPGTRMGLGLLALSQAPRSQGAQGLLGLLANEQAIQQQEMQRKVMQSQIDENTTQNRQREMQMQNAMAQQARENAYFGMGGAQPTTQGAGMITPGGVSSGGAPGSALGGGAPTEGKFDEWSRQYGIPKDALIADYLKNNGKGIAEMIYKRGTPSMKVTNGYAYDENKLGAGFMPSLSTSQDGKTSMVRIDQATGLPVVSAPQGSMETYAGYQAAQAAFKPIKVYNPSTGREEYTNERAVVQPQSMPSGPVRAQPQYSGPGYAGGSANAAAQGQLEVMQSEYNRLPEGHPDRPAIMREMQRLGGGQAAPQTAPQSGNYAAGPSAAEAAANEAARARAVDTAKADVVRDTGRQAEGKLANKLNSGIDRAIELLQQGPTSSAVGTLADKAMGLVGTSTKGGELAAQLGALSGWLVSNVPRMEGPQSNIDVQNYQTMAGRVGDSSLPIGMRLAAAQEVKRLQQKYMHLNGGESAGEQPRQQQQQATQREFSMLPNASQFDGKRMQAPDGTIYRSRGGKWTKE